MADLTQQVDPDELKRNLAIVMGSQPRQTPPNGPQMAAPPPQRTNELGGALPNDLAITTTKPQRGTIQGDQAARSDMLTKGAGEDQIYGKVTNSGFGQAHPLIGKILGGLGEGIAKAGDIGLSAVAPGIAAMIPGTEYHHAQDIGKINRQIGSEEKEGQEQATTAHTAQETAEAPQRAADTHQLAQAQVGDIAAQEKQREDAAQNPSLAAAYSHAVNQAIKEGRDPSQDPIVQHLGDAITSIQKQPAEQGVGKTIEKTGPDGKTHVYELNPKTGNYDNDQGLAGAKPAAVRVDSGAHEFQMNERGRTLLDKAEQQYRTAQQGANGLRDMIAQADAGNKVSAQVLPLQGALEITTAQGVHRINRTEVDQYAGAGSLWDKVAGELGKITEGQPIPPNIRQDMRKLADIEEKAAYQNYRGAHQSAVKRYNLQGEEPLPEPGGGEKGITVTAPNGKVYPFKDQASADAFKKEAGIK